MAKIGFKRLSRGARLLTGHIHNQIQRSLTRFTSTGVTSDNMESGESRFRMSFPWNGLQPKDGTSQERSYVQASFVLPPPQEMFRQNGSGLPEDITYVLETLMISVDQRGEALAINEDGSLNVEDRDKVAFTVNLFGKKPNAFGGSSFIPDTQLMSVDFDSLNYTNPDFVENPKMKTGLGISIDPYQTLVLEVSLKTFQGASQNLSIDSLVVSLDFSARLMKRDNAVASLFDVQNIPLSHKGARSIDPQSVVTPAASSIITADSNAYGDGIQTALERIDTVFSEKLKGGYDEKSSEAYNSNILTDAGYDVIAVPMWGNGWVSKGGAAGDDTGSLPYIGLAPYAGATCDRRIIPLHYPMVVHHVIACVNTGPVPPTSSTFINKIGVGIGCGVRSDLLESRQVAYAEWSPATIASYKIDETKVRNSYQQVLNIPLVYLTGNTGTGFDQNVSAALASTGTPVFIGQALDPEQPRTDLAQSVNAFLPFTPIMAGQEQFLEIRWEIQDSAGIANMPANEGVIGFGGHWVYIIGKKHLC